MEKTLEFSAEELKALFGENDRYLEKMERELNILLINRDGVLKVIGEDSSVEHGIAMMKQLINTSGKTGIEEQKMDYAIELSKDRNEEQLSELDKDIICHTMLGKPVKPKTLGQKHYVDAMKKDMITFGIGPAGTGKTYLAMAMAITAFKNNEVSKIILTRPAIEAGEKLGFLPGDLQSKVDPYLRPLYDALYQIMGAENFQKNMEKGLIEVALLHI